MRPKKRETRSAVGIDNEEFLFIIQQIFDIKYFKLKHETFSTKYHLLHCIVVIGCTVKGAVLLRAVLVSCYRLYNCFVVLLYCFK